MGKRAIGFGNLIDAATITASACESAHPITEVQTRELARYAKFTGASPVVNIDLLSTKAFQVICVIAHDIEAVTDTVVVECGSTVGGFDAHAGSTLSCWPFSPLNDDRDGSWFLIPVVLPSEISARHIELTFTTSAAPRIGRIFVGRMFEDCVAYGQVSDDWQPTNSTVDRTENGADWATTRVELRAAAFGYGEMTPAQASLWREIQRTHGTTGEIIHIADTEDRAFTQQNGFLGLMRKLTALEYPNYAHRSNAVVLDERGGAP